MVGPREAVDHGLINGGGAYKRGAYIWSNILVGKWMGLYPGGDFKVRFYGTGICKISIILFWLFSDASFIFNQNASLSACKYTALWCSLVQNMRKNNFR